MTIDTPFPVLRAVVIDTTNARETAEFYRQLLGYAYRVRDELPPAGSADPKGADWLVLVDPSGNPRLSFQNVDELTPATWPSPTVPMQLHIDLTVADNDALAENYARALALGATLILDRTDDLNEPLYVLADPAGHPFCLLVG